MESPPHPNTVRPAAPTDPATPIFDLAGASRTSGGMIQDWALGNVFNNADADDITKLMLGPWISWVQVFTTHADPTTTMPSSMKYLRGLDLFWRLSEESIHLLGVSLSFCCHPYNLESIF